MPKDYQTFSNDLISRHEEALSSSKSTLNELPAPPESPLTQKPSSPQYQDSPQEIDPSTPSQNLVNQSTEVNTDENDKPSPCYSIDHQSKMNNLKRAPPFDELKSPVEKALMEIAPFKMKSMLDRRKRARKNQETEYLINPSESESSPIWDRSVSVDRKTYSPKKIQRASYKLEQFLSVLCDGDKILASDVLVNLMTKRDLRTDFSQNAEEKIKSSGKTLDTRIVDGIVGFFEHHHSRGTRPTEEARAVDAVMVACCWDVCENDDANVSKSSEENDDANVSKSSEENDDAIVSKSSETSSCKKRVSNTALIDRLGINRGTFRRARIRAKTIKTEGESRYKPKERKPRKDKGVPAELYRIVKKVGDSTGSPRETNEYAAIDALSMMNTGIERNQIHQNISLHQPLHTSQIIPQSMPFGAMNQKSNAHLTEILYGNLGVSPSAFILAERSQAEQNARNIFYGAQRPSPIIGEELNHSYCYDQLLRFGPSMLQSSIVPTQASLLRYNDGHGRLRTPDNTNQESNHKLQKDRRQSF